jgi:hypothetical protein
MVHYYGPFSDLPALGFTPHGYTAGTALRTLYAARADALAAVPRVARALTFRSRSVPFDYTAPLP